MKKINIDCTKDLIDIQNVYQLSMTDKDSENSPIFIFDNIEDAYIYAKYYLSFEGEKFNYPLEEVVNILSGPKNYLQFTGTISSSKMFSLYNRDIKHTDLDRSEHYFTISRREVVKISDEMKKEILGEKQEKDVTVYKTCTIEKSKSFHHDNKEGSFWSAFTNDGRHIWNCQSVDIAKKLIDTIESTGRHPYTYISFSLN